MNDRRHHYVLLHGDVGGGAVDAVGAMSMCGGHGGDAREDEEHGRLFSRGWGCRCSWPRCSLTVSRKANGFFILARCERRSEEEGRESRAEIPRGTRLTSQ